VIASLQLDRRTARAAQALGYLLVSIPVALCAVLAVLLLVTGAALSLLGVGLPVLLAGASACRALLRVDRRVSNRLLRTQIPPLPPALRLAGSPWKRTLTTLSDRALWRMVAALAVRPPLVVVLVAVALVPIALLAEVLWLGSARSSTWARGRSIPGSASCCWRSRCPSPCWPSPCSTR